MRLDYFTKILEDDLKAIVKPQYVDRIPRAIKAENKTVQSLIENVSSMDNMTEVLDVLGEYFGCHPPTKLNLTRTQPHHGS